MNNMNNMNNNNKKNKYAKFQAKIAEATDERLTRMQANHSKRLNKALDDFAPDAKLERIQTHLDMIEAELASRAASATSAAASGPVDETPSVSIIAAAKANNTFGTDAITSTGVQPVADEPVALPPKFAAKLAKVSNLPTARLEKMKTNKAKAAAKAAAKGNTVRATRMSAFVDAIDAELAARNTVSFDESTEEPEESVSMDAVSNDAVDQSPKFNWLSKVPRHVLYKRRGKKRAALLRAVEADDPQEVAALQTHIGAINAEIQNRKSKQAAGDASGSGSGSGSASSSTTDEDFVPPIVRKAQKVHAQIETHLEAGSDIPVHLVRKLVFIQKKMLKFGNKMRARHGFKCGRHNRRGPRHNHGRRGPRHNHGPRGRPFHGRRHGPPAHVFAHDEERVYLA